MSTDTFWRIVVAGFIATFVMSMIAFIQGGIGLPVIDVGHFLKESFNNAHRAEVYDIMWGNAAYHIFGIMLAFIWVVFLQRIVPGNWLIQGLIYGVIISILAGLIVSPLIALAAGDSFGIFYTDTWTPGLMLLAGLIMHLGYGITLTLALNIAGVKGISSEG